jgi:hypothetical protein
MAQNKFTARVTLDLTLAKKLGLVSDATTITLIDALAAINTAVVATAEVVSIEYQEIWPIGPQDRTGLSNP